MRENRTKRKLQAGQAVFGALLKMPSPTAVELCAHAGFDFVLVDGEHGPANVEVCENLCRAAEATGITPLVRVQNLDPSTIARYLDAGVQGIQVPNIASKEEALRAVRSTKYFPEGSRTVAAARAADYGTTRPIRQYAEDANRELMVIAMIEDVQGVRNLEEIMSVDGIDVICVGPYDLAHSMGLPDQDHPELRAILERVSSLVCQSGKALGVPGDNLETARHSLNQGALYVAASVEKLWVAGAREFLARLHGEKSR